MAARTAVHYSLGFLPTAFAFAATVRSKAAGIERW